MTVQKEHIHLTDGVDVVNFHPSATARRRLSKREGIMIIHRANQSTPRFVSFKKSDDIWEIQTEMQNRVTDYQTFFNMVKEESNSSFFTLSVGTEIVTVVCLDAIMEITSGEGDLRTVIGVFEVVAT